MFSTNALPIGEAGPLLAEEDVSGSQTLRILNWEDYIYKYDPANGYEDMDMVEQFENYVRENYPDLQDVNVIYSTTDTNETMITKLETGGSHYDLVCPSDYGIQKLIAKDMVEPIKPKMEALGLENYYKYASPKMREYLSKIEATNEVTGEIGVVDDYSVGYMWGTLGIIFNPEYDLFRVNEETAIEEMADWSALWNENYHGSISIKDSMRDTYFTGLVETYKDELITALNKYKDGEYDAEEYNAIISEILNRCEPEQAEAVKKTLDELKKNIFGLEVDSGKQDIVTGKVGVNLAWSGDAVYSMALYDELNPDSEYGLLYSVPYTGANIFFDGWVMPKDSSRSSAQEKLALLFLDFISNPDQAAQNMNYIGYTSFIGGDTMLDLVKDWYDVRTETLYYITEEDGEEVYNSIFYDDPENSSNTEVWYEDYHKEEDNDSNYDDVKLYWITDDTYYTYYSPDEGESMPIPDEEKNYLTLEDDDAVEATYNNYLLIDPEWEEVDLSYFFNGTLDEYEDTLDTMFYSDYYLPFTNEDGSSNISVGSSFFTQYPNEDTMTRCVVMKDFGKNNDTIRKMWEDFKSNTLEPWIIVVFVVEVGLIAFGIIFVVVNKARNKKMRRLRREEAKSQK